jgi:hypothetical protein
MILLAALAALAGCQQGAAEDANVAVEANAADAAAPAATPAAMSLNETSWTFTMDGKAIQESIDAKGNYIANSGDEHVDHGSYVIVDGKHCFTSAMTKEGQECWTAPANTEVGKTADITSDKGKKLTVTRVAYAPVTM